MKINKNAFWLFRIAWPLFALGLVAGFAHWLYPANEFTPNILTELGGILVTLLYVDQLLDHRKEMEWRRVSGLVSQRVELFINQSCTELRTPFGIPPIPIFATREQGSIELSTRAMHREVLKQATEVTYITAETGLSMTDQKQWASLLKVVQSIGERADFLWTRFSEHLNPEQSEVLLNIQDRARTALTIYRVMPEVIYAEGQPPPKMRSDPKLVAKEAKEAAVKNIRDLIEHLKKLSAHTGLS